MGKQKKYHYIYKTTCNVTGKYYIGLHSTDNLEDGYMGSGKILKSSLNKHGKGNHTKEILEFCDNRKVLKGREEEIVNEQLLTESLCMNLALGGGGRDKLGDGEGLGSTLQFRIDDDMMTKIKIKLTQENMSMSDYIRELISSNLN